MECAELACWHALINLIAVRVAQQFFSDFTLIPSSNHLK